MSHLKLKSLSVLLTLTVVGVAVSAPSVAAEPSAPARPSPAAVSVPSTSEPDMEAAGSDHMNDNRTWRQIKVMWDWTMPDGIPEANAQDIPTTPLQPVPGYQEAGNALYGPLPDGATPQYQVVLNADGTNVKGRTTKLSCAWAIDAPTPVDVAASACSNTQTVALPEGTWPLELTVTDGKTGVSKTVSSQVQVLNVLMAVMGDSYAAGEGYPPFTNPDGTIDWDEPACDRSRWSGFVRAAVMAEQADARSNVTLVDVACSGAQILEQFSNTGVTPTGGLLSPQKKITQPSEQSDSGPGAYMPAQVDQLTAIAQGKTYDVNLFSIGGNDAGLSPIVQSCLLFDTGAVMLNKVLEELTSSSPATTPFPGCYANGQASIDLSSISNPANLKAECIGTTETSFAAKFFQILAGCQDVNGKPYVPLSDVADNNLKDLKTDTALLAPCLGAAGGATSCQTVKIVNNAPAPDYTPSDPVKITSIDNAAQAMYPDLTQKGSQGNTQACGVQQNPSQPWGGQINPNGDPFDPSKWTLGPNPLQNQLESPATQVDNTWILGHLYEGVAGRPVAVPVRAGAPYPSDPYPNNVPLLFDPVAAGAPPPASPNSVVPQSDGLVTQMAYNTNTYGWQTAMSMYNKSHPYGLCASDRWVTNLTDYFAGEEIHHGTGTGLHPNEAGYSAYGDMLGPLSIQMAGLPVIPTATVVDPLGGGVPTTITAKPAKKKVAQGHRAKLRIKVVGDTDPVPTGRVRIKGNKSTMSNSMSVTTNLRKDGVRVFKLPKKWTKLSKNVRKATVRMKVRYLGNVPFKASMTRAKVTIKR